MPWAFYLLLMQYGEDPFGSFPRAAIPAIIGVFLAASKLFIVNWRLVYRILYNIDSFSK